MLEWRGGTEMGCRIGEPGHLSDLKISPKWLAKLTVNSGKALFQLAVRSQNINTQGRIK